MAQSGTLQLSQVAAAGGCQGVAGKARACSFDSVLGLKCSSCEVPLLATDSSWSASRHLASSEDLVHSKQADVEAVYTTCYPLMDLAGKLCFRLLHWANLLELHANQVGTLLHTRRQIVISDIFRSAGFAHHSAQHCYAARAGRRLLSEASRAAAPRKSDPRRECDHGRRLRP